MNGMEIILIEDDEEAALPMLKFLRSNFVNPVRYIQDGRRAAEFLLLECDKCPKLILLDTVLPHIDGVELFRMIRLEPTCRNLSVLFLISDEPAKKYLEGLGLKPDGYLKKPTFNTLPAYL